MQQVFEELLQSFRLKSNTMVCVSATHLRSNVRRICSHQAILVGHYQFQTITCIKCGDYLKNSSGILIPEISCKCHSVSVDSLQYWYDYKE